MSQRAPAADPRLRRRGMPGLGGKNVLVTGGTSGIGQATAVRLAEHGANVAINYLATPDEASGTEEQVHTCLRTVRRHGVRDVLVRGDVSFEEDKRPWITHDAQGMLVALLLRRLAYNLLSLFKSVTQRSDEKRHTTTWKTLFHWVTKSLEQATEEHVVGLREREVQPVFS